MLVYSAHRDPGLSPRRLRHLPDEPSAHENISWFGAQILFYMARWRALQCKCRRVLVWLIDWLIDYWCLSKFRFPLWRSVKRVYVCGVDSQKKSDLLPRRLFMLQTTAATTTAVMPLKLSNFPRHLTFAFRNFCREKKMSSAEFDFWGNFMGMFVVCSVEWE